MKCPECNRELRDTIGVHYINGKWLLLHAGYCFRHGSVVAEETMRTAKEVKPDPTRRDHIRPGLHVLIYTKADQLLQKPTEGFVQGILTKSLIHTRGIKVRLYDGSIGRVQKILK